MIETDVHAYPGRSMSHDVRQGFLERLERLHSRAILRVGITIGEDVQGAELVPSFMEPTINRWPPEPQ